MAPTSSELLAAAAADDTPIALDSNDSGTRSNQETADRTLSVVCRVCVRDNVVHMQGEIRLPAWHTSFIQYHTFYLLKAHWNFLFLFLHTRR